MCDIFGMMKRDNVYSQIQPAPSLASDKIPTTGLNEVFTYLECTYSFDICNTVPKQGASDAIQQVWVRLQGTLMQTA